MSLWEPFGLGNCLIVVLAYIAGKVVGIGQGHRDAVDDEHNQHRVRILAELDARAEHDRQERERRALHRILADLRDAPDAQDAQNATGNAPQIATRSDERESA